MREEQLREIHEYADSPAFSAVEKAVLGLADAMTSTPSDVPDALFAKLRAELSDKQLVELGSAIAWENYRARFNRLFDVGTEDFSEGAFCPLPVGWTADAPNRKGGSISDRE